MSFSSSLVSATLSKAAQVCSVKRSKKANRLKSKKRLHIVSQGLDGKYRDGHETAARCCGKRTSGPSESPHGLRLHVWTLSILGRC